MKTIVISHEGIESLDKQYKSTINLFDELLSRMQIEPTCSQCNQPMKWDDCNENFTTYWCDTCDLYRPVSRH